MKISGKWISMWILIIIIALIVVGLKSCFEPKPYVKEEWKQEYAKQAATKVDLEFDNFKTTKDTYNEMHDSLVDYADSNFNIDKDEMQKDYTKLAKDDHIIYFPDAMLVRFKDKSNKDMKLTVQNINGNYEVSDGVKLIYEKKRSNHLTELEYIDKITSSIMKLLKANTDEGFTDAEQKAVYYFTVDAKEKLLNSKEELGVTDVTINSLAVSYIDIGKTDINKDFDRLYIELDLGDKKTNIIAKLNKYYKIYDFEIV